MGRVCKKEGSVVIVSHSPPISRKRIFKAALGFENFNYKATKQELSMLAQMINIMRAKLVDKPLTHILKDKDALIGAMFECFMSS